MFCPLCPECFHKPTSENRQGEVVSWPPHALDTDWHTFDCEDGQYERVPQGSKTNYRKPYRRFQASRVVGLARIKGQMRLHVHTAPPAMLEFRPECSAIRDTVRYSLLDPTSACADETLDEPPAVFKGIEGVARRRRRTGTKLRCRCFT